MAVKADTRYPSPELQRAWQEVDRLMEITRTQADEIVRLKQALARERSGK